MNGKKFKDAFKGVTFKDISNRGCVLCTSDLVAVTGIYLPGPDVQTHYGDGSPFAVIYSICKHCMKVPNAPAKCEEAIHAELGFSERGWC